MDFKRWGEFSFLCVSAAAMYINPDTLYAQNAYFVQAGSYSSGEKAAQRLHKLQKKIKLNGRVHSQLINGSTYYQVWIGPYNALRGAKAAQYKIHQTGEASFIRASQIATKGQHYSIAPKSNNSLPARQKTVHPPLTKLRSPMNKPGPRLNRAASPSNKPGPRLNRAASPSNKPGSPLNRAPSPSNTSLPSFNTVPSSYRSRGILNGTWATKTDFGDAEYLQPILSLSNGFAYVDGAGKYGSGDTWFLSAGTGLRTRYQDSIVGGYVFGDYNRSDRNKDFWIINPGLEYMNIHWDGVMNAYIPVSSKDKSFGIVPGFRLGIDSTHLSNHTIFEDFYNIVDTIGPGVDGEIGYTFNRLYNARAFVGSYYFHPKSYSDFVGVEGGIEVPISSRFRVVVHDAYDRVQGNTFMGTLRITLDANQSLTPLNNRLFDPIRRHLGAQQTGTGVPIIKSNKFDGRRATDTNAWFFSPTGTEFNPDYGTFNCTFEHPCNVFSQDAITGINTISPQASLVLNTGTYNNPLVGTGLTIFNGQQVIGRTNNFKRVAYGANRPLINDTLILSGNNNLYNLAINGNTTIGASRAGINIKVGVTTPIHVDNTLILTAVDGLALDSLGIQSTNNGALLKVTNSEIRSTITESATGKAIGISLTSAGTLQLANSLVSTTSFNSAGTKGIDLESTLGFIYNSSINVDTNFGQAIALVVGNSPAVNVISSQIKTTVKNNVLSTVTAYGVYTENSGVNFFGSEITLLANNYTSNGIVGLDTTLGGTTNLYGSSINIVGTNSANYVAGINIGTGNVNLRSSNVNLTLDNTGIINSNFGINGSSNANINLDGVHVSMFTRNMVKGVNTLENNGALIYQNTGLLVVGDTTNIKNYGGNGTIQNLGNVVCIQVINQVSSIVTCPG